VADVPRVAVIVGAYRRSEFLPAAVQSVLAQTIPREEFEVVVVTDRDDPDLRRGLERSGVRMRTDPEPRIGTWLLATVRETRAPLIAFLDDDDQFEPGRLAAVIEVCRAHPDVGLYRNRVDVVDRAGAAVSRDRWNPLEQDTGFDRSGPILVRGGDRAKHLELCRNGATITFNTSTMVVRRELLEGPAAEVFAETQLPDLALVVLAFLSPYALYLDDRRRTRYRSAVGSATHRVEWLRVAAESHARLAEHARVRAFPELATWLGDRAVHYDRMYRGETVVESVRSASSRRAVADGALEYLRFLGRHPREWSTELNVWAAALYAGGYVIAPGLARRLAVARPTAHRT
jgi:glycosyltransferase involved in cell wall biosynthesis